MYSLGTVNAEDSKGVTVADLSAYDDPDAKFGYELTPTPYSRLAKSINFVTGTTRRVKNRIVTIRDVSVAHTLQLIEDIKDLKNHPAAIARTGIVVTVPVIAFFMAPRGGGMARVKRYGYPLLAFGATATVCYPKPMWNLTKAGAATVSQKVKKAFTPAPKPEPAIDGSAAPSSAESVVLDVAGAVKESAESVAEAAAEVAEVAESVEASAAVTVARE